MSNQPTCAASNDRKVQHDQDVVCLPCLRLTRSRLHRVPQLVDDLEVSLARMAVLAERNDGGKSAETALAFTEAAGDALRQIRNVLTGWSRMLHEEQQVPLPQNRLVAMAAHVSVHARKLVAHAAAAEWVEEVRAMVAEATKVIDLPVNRARIRVGPCPQDYTNEHGAKEPCSGQVIATFPNDDTTEPTMDCLVCGAMWRSDQWNRTGKLIMERKGEQPAPVIMWCTVPYAAKIACVSEDTVRRAITAGLIPSWRESPRTTRLWFGHVQAWIDGRVSDAA